MKLYNTILKLLLMSAVVESSYITDITILSCPNSYKSTTLGCINKLNGQSPDVDWKFIDGNLNQYDDFPTKEYRYIAIKTDEKGTSQKAFLDLKVVEGAEACPEGFEKLSEPLKDKPYISATAQDTSIGINQYYLCVLRDDKDIPDLATKILLDVKINLSGTPTEGYSLSNYNLNNNKNSNVVTGGGNVTPGTGNIINPVVVNNKPTAGNAAAKGNAAKGNTVAKGNTAANKAKNANANANKKKNTVQKGIMITKRQNVAQNAAQNNAAQNMAGQNAAAQTTVQTTVQNQNKIFLEYKIGTPEKIDNQLPPVEEVTEGMDEDIDRGIEQEEDENQNNNSLQNSTKIIIVISAVAITGFISIIIFAFVNRRRQEREKELLFNTLPWKMASMNSNNGYMDGGASLPQMENALNNAKGPQQNLYNGGYSTMTTNTLNSRAGTMNSGSGSMHSLRNAPPMTTPMFPPPLPVNTMGQNYQQPPPNGMNYIPQQNMNLPPMTAPGMNAGFNYTLSTSPISSNGYPNTTPGSTYAQPNYSMNAIYGTPQQQPLPQQPLPQQPLPQQPLPQQTLPQQPMVTQPAYTQPPYTQPPLTSPQQQPYNDSSMQNPYYNDNTTSTTNNSAKNAGKKKLFVTNSDEKDDDKQALLKSSNSEVEEQEDKDSPMTNNGNGPLENPVEGAIASNNILHENSLIDPNRLSKRISTMNGVTQPVQDDCDPDIPVSAGYDARELDELTLQIGDTITVKAVYTDGWGWGINNTTKEEGVFPIVCLARKPNLIPTE